MATQQDFDMLRILAVDCVWAVQALLAHRDRTWPPTRRHADYDAWQHRNLQRDIEQVMFVVSDSFTVCKSSADAIRYDFKPELIDPIRQAVAGRPVTFCQDVYTTAHEAAFKVCEGMDDLRRDAHAEAEQDADRYDFAFVDAALRMLRDVPNVKALESGIEHEYQLVVKGLPPTKSTIPNPDNDRSTADKAIDAIQNAGGEWINAPAIGKLIGKTDGAVRSALSRAKATRDFPIESCQTGENLGYRWTGE